MAFPIILEIGRASLAAWGEVSVALVDSEGHYSESRRLGPVESVDPGRVGDDWPGLDAEAVADVERLAAAWRSSGA